MKQGAIIKVFGKVQGVGFRYYTQRKAVELGITGFVQNRPDGSVYIEAEGEEEDLDAHANDIQKYIETQVIGVNEKLFRLIFMVGLGVFKSFFTYGIADRRNIFEFMVGINILSIMAKKIKKFNSKIEVKKNSIESKIEEFKRLEEVYVQKLKDVNVL